jgi:hypothetical protein
MGGCPKRGHGALETPVLATGRSDVATIKPDRIEAVIVIRDGPIPPTMNEAIGVVSMFVPLIVDDAPLIHIRRSKPGLMTERSCQEELALTRIHDLEREGILAPGAWNRSECIFAKSPEAFVSSYLLTVIGKAEDFTPGDAKVHPLQSEIIDRVLRAAEKLPVARDGDVQCDFDSVGPKWGAREILALPGGELRRRLEAVCSADTASGFTVTDVSMPPMDLQADPVPYVQLNTFSATLRTFRPYRIMKRNDGRFAVYGHPALYNV